MVETVGRVCGQRQARVLWIRVHGRGTSQLCPDLRQFVEHGLADQVDHVRIDLAECAHMDSTFVGTLLFLGRQPALKASGGVQLVAPSPECRRVLQQMAVLRIFKIDESADGTPQDGWTELATVDSQRGSWLFKQNVVEAHEELAAVPGPLSDSFRGIAESCRRELDAAKSTEKPG